MKATFYVLNRSAERGMEYLRKTGERVSDTRLDLNVYYDPEYALHPPDPETGERIPDAQLELYVYKTEDASKPVDPKTGKHPKIWYVVEGRCGLALCSGKTKQGAIDEAVEVMNRYGASFFEKAIQKSIEQYGGTPDHRAFYL